MTTYYHFIKYHDGKNTLFVVRAKWNGKAVDLYNSNFIRDLPLSKVAYIMRKGKVNSNRVYTEYILKV